MSRTDKDLPDWVGALHAAQNGRVTNVYHSHDCVDYENEFTGAGPRGYTTKRVNRTDAEANGWPLSPYWAHEPGETVLAHVPFGPFPCDVDTATSRCSRYITGRERRTLCPCCSAPHNPRRRAAERDWLRAVAKEYHASDGLDIDPHWEPLTHGVNEAKTPWQGRYLRSGR